MLTKKNAHAKFSFAPDAGLLEPVAVNSECDVECRRLALVHEVQAAIVQSDRRLAADWSDIWAHSAAVDQFFDGARSRSGSSASIGSIALFLPRQTTSTWRSRASTEIFSFLAKSFSLAPQGVAQCFEDNHLSLAVSGSESAMLGERSSSPWRDGPCSSPCLEQAKPSNDNGAGCSEGT